MTRTLLRVAVALLVVMAGAVGAVAPGAATGDASGQELQCEFPATFEDAGGEDVQIDEQPDEIVTLNPSAAQTMWEIGAEDRVTGVSQYAMYLDGAEERTDITDEEGGTSVEQVIDLEPDLVLAPNTIPEDTVDQLRTEGDLTVYHFESATSIDDVREKTELIGQLVGECEGAEDTVAWMDDELEEVADRIEGEEPTIYFEFFETTAGQDTFQDDVLSTAGGENVAAAAGIEGWGQMSQEQLAEQNPDWLLIIEGHELPSGEGVEQSTALQEDNVVEVTEEHMQQPAPRVVYAVSEINEHLYAESDENGVADEEVDDETTGDDTAADDEEPDAIPGFGIAAALAALLSVVALRRR